MTTALFGLLRPLWPYFAAFALGGFMAGGVAWKVQGLRLTAAQQEFTDYKQTQKQLIQEAKDAADRQRDQARENFTGAVKVLAADIEAGAAYNRCLAAGKCGRVRDVPTCADLRLPSASRTDAAGADAVPAARDPAPEVVIDCAKATLLINQLQNDIENQPGYDK
ncbi:MAG: hypothetical protein WC023_01460 [Rhodocyclaceae bacterium]